MYDFTYNYGGYRVSGSTQIIKLRVGFRGGGLGGCSPENLLSPQI